MIKYRCIFYFIRSFELIKENQKILNALNVIADAVIVLIAMLFAYITRFLILQGTESIPLNFYIYSALIVSPMFIILFGMTGLYESQRSSDFLRTAEKVAVVSLLCTIGLATVFFIIRSMDVSRWMLTFFFVYSTLLLALKRFIITKALRGARLKGRNLKYVLLIGSGDYSLEYLEAVKSQRWLGYSVIGSVGSRALSDELFKLGDFEELDRILEVTRVDEAVAALSVDEIGYMAMLIELCEKHGVKLSLIPFCAPYILSHPRMDAVGSVPLMNIRYIPLDNIVYGGIKRLADIIFSLLLIILLSPLMLAAALGTLISAGRPIIFKQIRVGLGKKNFTMYKFRSMRDAKGRYEAWSGYDKARVTAFGAFMRKFSIDELPQLFNVLKGDMSLIGPRPELPRFVEEFKQSIPLYMVKHQVRPGMTGWAQVNGYRGDTSIEARIHCDLYYIENWSLLLDLKILLMTVFKITNNEEGILNGKKESKRKKHGGGETKSADEGCSKAENLIETEREEEKSSHTVS